MSTDDWFLSTEERGNPFTRLAHRRGGRSFSESNRAELHVHGAAYFARLRELVEAQGPGDLLLFTDWRGDPDERIGEDGLSIVELMSAAAGRGVVVKGLFWRSHLDSLQYSEAENRSLADAVRAAGGEVILDQRVLPLGSHHQKLVVLRHGGSPERDVAFCGGIDLCHTRRDDARHLGDPQTVSMGAVWGPTLDPLSRLSSYLHHDDDHPDPLPPQAEDPAPCGEVDVQVLRTYPRKRPRFPFAPDGERSIARAYGKAIPRAERLIYLEDQFVWSTEVMAGFAEALRAHPELHIIVVLSTYTTADTTITNAGAMDSRNAALAVLHRAGGDRVHVYGLESAQGFPVYVHSKLCLVDDAWMLVGSDNMNLRSWTFDSELSCALVDQRPDPREPRVLRADGDSARVLPRQVRLDLAREHLDRAEGEDGDLVDPLGMVTAFAQSAAALDAWHDGGEQGHRPAGRLRSYTPQRIPPHLRAAGRLAYRIAEDPDARPRALRGTGRF